MIDQDDTVMLQIPSDVYGKIAAVKEAMTADLVMAGDSITVDILENWSVADFAWFYMQPESERELRIELFRVKMLLGNLDRYDCSGQLEAMSKLTAPTHKFLDNVWILPPKVKKGISQ